MSWQQQQQQQQSAAILPFRRRKSSGDVTTVTKALLDPFEPTPLMPVMMSLTTHNTPPSPLIPLQGPPGGATTKQTNPLDPVTATLWIWRIPRALPDQELYWGTCQYTHVRTVWNRWLQKGMYKLQNHYCHCHTVGYIKALVKVKNQR